MITQDFVKQLLAHMGMEDTEISSQDNDENVLITIQVSEQDSGLLIGHHAETIDALQRIVRLACQKDGEKPIIVNVNDFRERRAEHVREIAHKVAERAIETGQDQMIHLPAHERRLIHMELAENTQVETVSEGEGSTRVLYVRLKKTA